MTYAFVVCQQGHHGDEPSVRSLVPCGCMTVNGSLPCDRHFRSRILDHWPSASIDEVNETYTQFMHKKKEKNPKQNKNKKTQKTSSSNTYKNTHTQIHIDTQTSTMGVKTTKKK